MLNSKLIGLISGACLLLSGQVQARLYDDVIKSGYISIGVYRDFPPYSFEKNGKPQGVDVDLGRDIAKSLKVKLKLHWITPGETLDDDLRTTIWKGSKFNEDQSSTIAKKRVADVMLRVPYDREYSLRRDKATGELVNDRVVMLAPYQKERWQLAYDSKKLSSVTTLAKFQYNPIGVEIDSVPAFYMTSAFGGRMRKNTHHYASPEKAFAAMQKGEVSAVMAMRGQIDWLLHQSGDARYRPAENGFPMMGKQMWDIGIAIRDKDRQLGYAVGDVIDHLVRDGEMAALYKRYGMTYEKPSFYTEVE